MTDQHQPSCAHEHAPRQARVSLMADYGCYLWTDAPELTRCRDPHGHLDLERAGVSAELARALGDWHAEWEEASYGRPWPVESDVPWSRRGWELALRLQDELGPAIQVRYFHGIDHGGQGAGWNKPVLERKADLDRGPEPAVLELRPGRDIATLRLQSPGAPPFDEGHWLDPQELGIDPHLGTRLREWNGAWPAVRLSVGEPVAPGRRQWADEGHRLADLLRDVLARHGHVEVVLDDTR